jgi:hypothetical protein
MDQTRTEVADGAARGASAVPVTSPASSGWDAYYKQASVRRRSSGSARRFRAEKRRRRFRERIVMGISVVFVGTLTAIFYMLLR